MEQAQEHFTALQQEYYQAWLRYHPEESVLLGKHEHAQLLRSHNHDDIGALITLNHKLLSALDELDTESLDNQQQIDARILRGAAQIELHELEERDWRYRNPVTYLPVDGLFQLLTHPVKDVHTAIKHKLEAIPEHIRGAQSLLSQSPEQVVPAWLENAIEQGHSGADFLRNLVRHPLLTKLFSNPAKLQPLLDEAAKSLEGFARFLESDISAHASGDFACGTTHFNRLLNERHFLATDVDAVIALGERLYKKTRQELADITQKMQGNDDVDALLEKIRSNHPDKDHVLDIYRERMRATTSWLEESDIVSLPKEQSLTIQQTPGFLSSHIPFAAYDPPMLNDKNQHGYYYITIPENDEELKEHNYTSIHLTCAHEAFPGHHMQFVLANQYCHDNIVRTLNTSASMYEGWALYCEQLVIDQGLLVNDEHRFMSLRDRLWRCLRIIIDCSIHTGKMTLQQAVDKLVSELGFSEQQARGELSWYTAAPTTPLCYATGCEMITLARKQIVEGSNADLQLFHDSLLKHGSIALPLVLQQSFSPVVWNRIHSSLFLQGEAS